MKVLIADDDELSRRMLEYVLSVDAYGVEIVNDGPQALRSLTRPSPPAVAILDIVMPGMDGVEICRRVRALNEAIPPYIILLTFKSTKQDVVEGLKAGANDYVVKPFDPHELRARVRVGARLINLQQRLSDRVRELEEALACVRHLQGLLREDLRTYEFGPFRLEGRERRLTRGGQVVPLTAKVFDLLLLLVRNGGHLLEKEEVMRELWPHSAVEENNLTVSMSVLRKALGEGAGGEYIETVPKRGYRFVEEVRHVDQGD